MTTFRQIIADQRRGRLARRCVLVASLALTALAQVGCATQQSSYSAPPDPMTGAIQQPFKDLGLFRVVTPNLLTQAVAEPYRFDPDATCAEIHAQIEALTALIGPDLDVIQGKHPSQVEEFLSGTLDDTLYGAFGLPYRGILRRITGAEARDKAQRLAVASAAVRRGFLRGVMIARACNENAPQTAQPAQAEDPVS